MSSADNHKARSRRGYKKTRMIMAPRHSPMIAHDKRRERKIYRSSISQLFLGKKAAG